MHKVLLPIVASPCEPCRFESASALPSLVNASPHYLEAGRDLACCGSIRAVWSDFCLRGVMTVGSSGLPLWPTQAASLTSTPLYQGAPTRRDCICHFHLHSASSRVGLLNAPLSYEEEGDQISGRNDDRMHQASRRLLFG